MVADVRSPAVSHPSHQIAGRRWGGSRCRGSRQSAGLPAAEQVGPMPSPHPPPCSSVAGVELRASCATTTITRSSSSLTMTLQGLVPSYADGGDRRRSTRCLRGAPPRVAARRHATALGCYEAPSVTCDERSGFMRRDDREIEREREKRALSTVDREYITTYLINHNYS